VLLGTAGEFPEGLQPLGSGPPVTHPVMDQTQQLEHLRHSDGPLDELVQDPSGIRETLVVKGPGRLLEAPQCTATSPVAEGPT